MAESARHCCAPEAGGPYRDVTDRDLLPRLLPIGGSAERQVDLVVAEAGEVVERTGFGGAGCEAHLRQCEPDVARQPFNGLRGPDLDRADRERTSWISPLAGLWGIESKADDAQHRGCGDEATHVGRADLVWSSRHRPQSIQDRLQRDAADRDRANPHLPSLGACLQSVELEFACD